MAHNLSDAVFKFFQTDTSTDRPTTLSVKELTTPSMKNNSFTLSVVGQYTLIETPKYVWQPWLCPDTLGSYCAPQISSHPLLGERS